MVSYELERQYPEEWWKEYVYENYRYLKELMTYNIPKEEDINLVGSLKSPLAVAIFTYNQPEATKLQLSLLSSRGFRRADVILIDDSNPKEAFEIQKIARNSGSIYLHVPRIADYRFEDIYYHNQALNYAYYAWLKYLNCERLMLLDHDIFPLHGIDISEYFRYDYYGVTGLLDYETPHLYYPWPGFSVFNLKTIGESWNFFQDWLYWDGDWRELDTGGAMRRTYFDTNPTLNQKWVNREKIPYKNDYYEVIDREWLHLRDLSNWSGKNLNKIEILNKLKL